MYSQIFELAGQRIKLQLDMDIKVSDKMSSFLCKTKDGEIHCTIVLKSVENLLLPGKEGTWSGLNYYEYYGDELRVYHYEKREEPPCILARVMSKDFIQIQYLSECEDFFSGTWSVLDKVGLETLLLYRNCLLIHASFVKYRNKAILFSACSGMGKSTQADLWKSVMGAEIINGDRAALNKQNGVWCAWGIPYAGTSNIYINDHASIAAIIILRQAKENKVEKISVLQAFSCLYPEILIHHWDEVYVRKVTDLIDDLLKNVPVFMLECRPDIDAVQLLHEMLKKEGLI